MATVNPWARFRALLPTQVRYRAEVISIDTVRGTSYVELSTGDRITVSGTAVSRRRLSGDGHCGRGDHRHATQPAVQPGRGGGLSRFECCLTRLINLRHLD